MIFVKFLQLSKEVTH